MSENFKNVRDVLTANEWSRFSKVLEKHEPTIIHKYDSYSNLQLASLRDTIDTCIEELKKDKILLIKTKEMIKQIKIKG